MQNPKSVDDQFRECRQYAERQGWIVAGTFADRGISGATGDRPEYRRLLSSVQDRKFDIVLVEHLDRLGRDIEQVSGFYKAASHADTEIYQIGRRMGIMDIGILSTFATLFLEDLGKKTRRGIAGKVAGGNSGGGLSYGYRVAKNGNGEVIKGKLEVVDEQAAIIRRIFREYADGISPQKIAEGLNHDGIPAPRGRGDGSGHWKQNTLNGNRERATGILNNELYIGRYLWGRLRYSKHPETGKRVSRPVPREDWLLAEMPDLRILDQNLWLAVKERQDSLARKRSKRSPTDTKGLSASQELRRRKYLLSGLLRCARCGGKLTVAGSAKTRRYYCANAKEKGSSVCEGMPGLKENHAAETILSSLREHLMQDEAFQEFKTRYLHHLQHQEKDNGEALRLHDQKTRELEKKISNLMDAIENGQHSSVIVERLNSYDEELKMLQRTRARLVPKPIELPDDMPSLYRGYIDNLVATLTDEGVAGRASDELHELLDRVVVSYDQETKNHVLDMQGNLIAMLNKAKPADEAGLDSDDCSLKLVAGVGFEPTTFRL
ncbi:recombinase family protein [Ruegeria sp. MALMAid1280]|uniref:recombinase family protein n=1 Tax=Ruegeria sp. MALMAid1280 TaxID=3411634 RepID=UPI003BA2531D